jgi:acyl CoA:acetate/3-ketoacid CoA transferase
MDQEVWMVKFVSSEEAVDLIQDGMTIAAMGEICHGFESTSLRKGEGLK